MNNIVSMFGYTVNVVLSKLMFRFLVFAVSASKNCTESEFQCRNGKCIRENRKCNSFNDCGDGSDEEEAMCGTYVVPFRGRSFTATYLSNPKV